MNILEIALNYPNIIKKGLNRTYYLMGVSINSREVSPNDLFIGIIGERFDGAKFFEDANKNGACGIVVDKRSTHIAEIEKTDGINFIVVEDSLAFLQFLAKGYVECWKKQHFGRVVCITGSNGKTTTKEMLFHLLSGGLSGQVIATKGNLNNDIGVPLTMLRIKKTPKLQSLRLEQIHLEKLRSFHNWRCQITALLLQLVIHI